MPDECYHLAAQSFIPNSSIDEKNTLKTNIDGTHNILSCIKNVCPNCKVFYAGTSEIFGNINQIPQNEKSNFTPRSIYGISKLVGYKLTQFYRNHHQLFSCSILYNHESPRRGNEFVTKKLQNQQLRLNSIFKNIKLGNINSKRDWGYAGDFVKAMHAMLLDTPEDFVIGTNEVHSVEEFLETAFKIMNLNYKDYLIIDRNL